MRSLLLATLGVTAFSATMAVDTPEANAVVYRAGCVARPGAVVRPGGVASVRGVARRTTRRVVRRSDMMLKHDTRFSAASITALAFIASATTAVTRPMSA